MKKNLDAPKRDREPPKLRYQPPQVIIYQDSELLARFGPARACASFNPFLSDGKGKDKSF